MKSKVHTKKKQTSVTFVAPSSGRVIIDNGVSTTGGAEAQISYLSNMIVSTGGRVNILTANVGTESSVDGSNKISVVKLWSKRAPAPIKVLQLIHRVLTSDSYLYIRGISIVGFLIAILSRIFLKRVVVALTSDLNCVAIPGKFWRNWWTKATLRVCSKVIAQTKDQQKLLSQNLGVASVVFPSVIELSKFDAIENLDFASRDVDVLWVSTVEPRKGIENLLSLAEMAPELTFRAIGGPAVGGQNYFNAIQEKANSLNNVYMSGFVDPDKVLVWMKRSKILLHTSVPVHAGLTKEGFPNVFLESWASGLMVVSLFVNPDGVLDSKDIGFRINSLEEAATILRKYTRIELEWRELSMNCKDFVNQRNSENVALKTSLIEILTDTKQ